MLLALAMLAAQAPAAVPVAEKPVKEKKVCKYVGNTGSILEKRECRTKSEWAEIAKRNQENADRYANDRAQGNARLGGQGN